MVNGFVEKLAIISKANRSLLCIGLDPEQQLIPDNRVFEFNSLVIEATADYACAFKPNLALYESMGSEGMDQLVKTLDKIREVNPRILIIGDAKRADIGNCSLAYVKTLFGRYDFDAVTVSPYMGSDSLQPFLERKEKGVFVLCRTSNPGGKDLQELMVYGGDDAGPRPLYEMVAELAKTWNSNGNVGLVVGATYPEQMGRIRQICPDMTFLIPGIGAQGGDLSATVNNAKDANGSGFIVSVSRQIMYAAMNRTGKVKLRKDALNRMRGQARLLRRNINANRRGLPGIKEPRANSAIENSAATRSKRFYAEALEDTPLGALAR